MNEESLSIILDENEIEKIVEIDGLEGSKVKVIITTETGLYEVTGFVDSLFL